MPAAITAADLQRALARPAPWWRRAVQRAAERRPWAAVAVVFRSAPPRPVPGPRGLEVLLIRRAVRAGDRWSGDVAFPGGMVAPHDATSLDTARREASEEVGLTLGAPLGRLDAVSAVRPRRLLPMGVVPWVFWCGEPHGALEAERGEVAALHWVPWDALVDPRNRGVVLRDVGPLRVPFSSVAHRGLVVWGLTLAMIDDLAAKIAA